MNFEQTQPPESQESNLALFNSFFDEFSASIDLKTRNSMLELLSNTYPSYARSRSEEPIIPYLIESAKIIQHINLNEESIIATLFSHFPSYLDFWQEKITPIVGENVVQLIKAINEVDSLIDFVKTAKLNTVEEKIKQAESMRKMLLAMVTDIRVVLIKLAMVTRTMQTLNKASNTVNKKEIAKETMSIFAPLANRLGIWQIKWQLEDLGLANLEPEKYKEIAQLINEKRDERLEFIKNFQTTLKEELHKNGIKCEVEGRPKHIYSIYKKMQKKRLSFQELYDIRAVRVLVDTIPDCYTTLGVVHSLWKPISGEFDDYISKPKANEYQSLHTVVVGPQDKGVEVQIRTFEMHQFAEFGVAAHWKYKEGGRDNSEYEQKIAWLRQLLEWKDNVEDQDKTNLAKAFQAELFKDTIYVLTPQGKVLSLPSGSTPIDFAYAVHSDLGNRCRGAKINGQIVPLSTVLDNGQRVEIITAKEGNPSLNWLQEGWVKSTKAISKIRSFIRRQNINLIKESGKHSLEKELDKIDRRPSLHDITELMGFQNIDELYTQIGKGELSVRSVTKQIKKASLTAPPIVTEESIIRKSRVKHGSNDSVTINGETGVLFVLAKCCKPAPPDEIIGFITRDRGVSIHRTTCTSFLHLANKHPEKILEADWSNLSQEKVFSIDIEIKARDRNGLLRDISETFSRNKINVTSVQTYTGDSTASMKFTVDVHQVNDLPKVLSKLGEIKDVFAVHRS